MALRTVFLIAAAVLAAGCAGEPAGQPAPPTNPPDDGRAPPEGPFAVASTAFEHMQPIPSKHTCDAQNVSPELVFENLPANATTLALIMDDPDAPSGTVLHWTFWNLPANVTRLVEGADLAAHGASQGQPYRGPCPPAGEHRYFFYAYAVAGQLELEDGSSVGQLRSALAGNTEAESEMYGTYLRPQLPPVQ